MSCKTGEYIVEYNVYNSLVSFQQKCLTSSAQENFILPEISGLKKIFLPTTLLQPSVITAT
jgi:hypothetical protein